VESQNDSQQAAYQGQEERHRARMATDFDYMCMQTTQGRFNLSLLPKDYEPMRSFENAFRHVAAEFSPIERARLRNWYQRQGYSAKSADKKIVVKLLGRVMDECQSRGFNWPRSLLKVKSDLTREIAQDRKPGQETETTTHAQED
jgi:hypothetical protein